MRIIKAGTYRLALLALAVAAITTGCGGGGGGSSIVSVSVVTDWTAAATVGVPTGASERVTVRPIINPSVITTTLNLNSTGAVQSASVSVPPAQYVFHVDLFPGSGQAGTPTGSLDAVVSVGSGSSVKIAVNQPIAGLTLAPSPISIPIGQSSSVYAGPTSASGSYTFASPTDLSFSSSTPAAVTVVKDATDTCKGELAGVASGTTSVSVTAASSNVTSTAASVTCTGGKQWTIMVWLNAANSLQPDALPNFLQMQEAVQGTNAQIIVAWKEAKSYSYAGLDWSFTGADDTRYYLVQPSTGTAIVGAPIKDLGQGVDMGTVGSLNTFIAYCKKNYPAQRYLLDMWDHGNGWQSDLKRRAEGAAFRGVSYDFETGNHIDTWQMDQAFVGGNSVDVLSYDACEMQMIECGYQVRNYVKYIVGSEDLTPGPGYDYSLAFLPFFTNATADTPTLCHGFVDMMVNATESGGAYAGQAVCQSIVDTSQLTAVAGSVDALGVALLANKSTIGTIVDNARLNGKRYDTDYWHMYFDMENVANLLQTSTGVPSAVATAAAKVQTACANAVLYNRADSLDTGSNGLGFDFSDGSTFASVIFSGVPSASSQYANLAFAKDYPHWYAWLQVAP